MINAQFAVAIQEAGDAVALLGRLLLAPERQQSLHDAARVAELLERAAHRIRTGLNAAGGATSVVAEPTPDPNAVPPGA